MIDNLIYKNTIFKSYTNAKLKKKLSLFFDHILNEILKDIENPNKIFSVLKEKYNFNFQIKDIKRFQKFNSIVIVGMGGSILGSEAIYEFLSHKIKKNFYFLDNIDEEKILKIKKEINFKKTLFLIISKSGNTIETISNSFFLNILKNNSKNIICISEKKNNFIYNLSKKFNLYHVEHKYFIGGRYSVLSEVGMLPAYLMGLNLKKFRKNLKIFFKGNEKAFLKDSVIKLSHILSNKKISNLIFLNYAPRLEKFLFWSQQLIAESLGKKGKGFLPMISNSPKDHHSLLQLYLDGPNDKIFYIFSEEKKSHLKFKNESVSKNIKFLYNKGLHQIKESQRYALIKVFKSKNIPFREFKINNVNEETLGELFAYFILETIIIGKISNLNPFNQPAVEEVKIITKKLLN